jgi:hypothetical protein
MVRGAGRRPGHASIPYSDRQQRRSHFQQAIALKGLLVSLLSEVGRALVLHHEAVVVPASIFNMRV